MKIKTITYKRIQNIGNYSAEHLEFVAEINENEDAVECGKRLREKTKETLELREKKHEIPWG